MVSKSAWGPKLKSTKKWRETNMAHKKKKKKDVWGPKLTGHDQHADVHSKVPTAYYTTPTYFHLILTVPCPKDSE